MATEGTNAPDMAAAITEDATQLVNSRFSEAQGYAAAAWNAAEGALADLANFTAKPDLITSIPVDFDYIDTTITSGLLGTIPEIPEIDIDIDADLPTIGDFLPLPVFEDVITPLRSAIATFMLALVEDGATGLHADVEAALWARMKSRNEVENLRIYTEAEQFFSARGYSLPPGVLAARLNEIGIEIARNNTYLNNDISIEQARLAQTNQHWVLEQGVTFVLGDMQMQITAIVETNKNTIAKYEADVDYYKQLIAKKIARIEALTKIYEARTEAYKALATIAAIDIEAQARNAELQLKKAEAEANLRIKAAEITMDLAAKVHALQVEALKAIGGIASQIAASAISSVNATASLGASGSANLSSGFSYGYDQTKSVESGATTSNIHTYDETKAT